MDALSKAAAEIQQRHPTLAPGKAYELALQADPDLARRHHHGDVDQPHPEPPVVAEPEGSDPGAAMLAAIGAYMAGGMSREVAEAKVFADAPLVAQAWHRGELIPKAQGGSNKVGAPVAIFRAPSMAFRSTGLEDDDGDRVEGVLKEVEIFSTGTWNGTRYDSKAIDELVASFDHLGYRPPITLGHNAAEDALAHGYVSKVYRRGEKVLADLAGIPLETMQAIRQGRILSVSAEIYLGLKRNGRTFPFALRCLSLLGAHPPGVNLRPIAESLPKLEV